MKKKASIKRVNHMISSLSHTKKHLSTLFERLPHQLAQMLQAFGTHFIYPDVIKKSSASYCWGIYYMPSILMSI